jgi:hypothetical protein
MKSRLTVEGEDKVVAVKIVMAGIRWGWRGKYSPIILNLGKKDGMSSQLHNPATSPPMTLPTIPIGQASELVWCGHTTKLTTPMYFN